MARFDAPIDDLASDRVEDLVNARLDLDEVSRGIPQVSPLCALQTLQLRHKLRPVHLVRQLPHQVLLVASSHAVQHRGGALDAPLENHVMLVFLAHVNRLNRALGQRRDLLLHLQQVVLGQLQSPIPCL